MKRLACFSAVVVAVGCLAAALNISQPQATTDAALETLGFKKLPNTSGVIGGPTTFTVAHKTIDLISKLHEDDKRIVVKSDGSITIE